MGAEGGHLGCPCHSQSQTGLPWQTERESVIKFYTVSYTLLLLKVTSLTSIYNSLAKEVTWLNVINPVFKTEKAKKYMMNNTN